MDKQKLVEENVKLVYYMIRKHYPTHIKDEDIIQEGMLGLCQAADTFDESKGKFVTYASKCILNAIRYYFKRNSKHFQVLSYDREVDDSDGNKVPFIEMIVGDEDIDLLPVDCKLFYDSLTSDEKELLGLLLTHTQAEVGEYYGISQHAVSCRFRKIRLKWRKFIGNDKD